MCERGILPVSPSSNSTVMRSPSSSRPSKPVGGGRGQGRPVAWAPWQTRGRGSRHQPASSPRPRTHEGRWAVEQDVGFAPGRPRTVGSPGPGRHVHPSRALPRVTTTSVGPHSRGSRPQDGGCNNAGLSEDDTRVDERDPSGLGPLCHREGSQLSKGSPAGVRADWADWGSHGSGELYARTLGTAEEGGGHHTNQGDSEVQTLDGDPQPHS